MYQSKICCFTGHRKVYNAPEVIARLRRTVRQLAESGITTFRAGGAVGFDMLAALCVLEIREDFGLRLELYLPCRNQADRWSPRDKQFYYHILESADSVEYVSETYTYSCMYDRNRRMLYDALTAMGYEMAQPDGAFYLFIKAPGGDAAAFSEKAKQKDLLVVPGDSFGCPDYFRLCYCVSYETIQKSLPLFAALIKE